MSGLQRRSSVQDPPADPSAHHSRTAAVCWAGVGRTGFAGSSGSADDRRLAAREAGESWEGPSEGARPRPELVRAGEARRGGASGLSRALAEFVSTGRSACVVLDDPRFSGSPLPGASSAAIASLAASWWLGTDEGPGYRGGVHALAERDDVGTIVVTEPCPARILGAILDLAESRPDVLFLLEESMEAQEPTAAAGSGDAVLRMPRRNVAVLTRSSPDALGLGALAGYLEACDFAMDPPYRPAPAPPPPWLPERESLQLRAWRREAGLRRSLDMGTRWVVFEPNGPFLWRRVERDITLFLRRLEARGFLDRTAERPAFTVRSGAVLPGGVEDPVGGGSSWMLRSSDAPPRSARPGGSSAGVVPQGGVEEFRGHREDSSTEMFVHVTARLAEPFATALRSTKSDAEAHDRGARDPVDVML